jgi:hypothetical protein
MDMYLFLKDGSNKSVISISWLGKLCVIIYKSYCDCCSYCTSYLVNSCEHALFSIVGLTNIIRRNVNTGGCMKVPCIWNRN